MNCRCCSESTCALLNLQNSIYLSIIPPMSNILREKSSLKLVPFTYGFTTFLLVLLKIQEEKTGCPILLPTGTHSAGALPSVPCLPACPLPPPARASHRLPRRHTLRPAQLRGLSPAPPRARRKPSPTPWLGTKASHTSAHPTPRSCKMHLPLCRPAPEALTLQTATPAGQKGAAPWPCTHGHRAANGHHAANGHLGRHEPLEGGP